MFGSVNEPCAPRTQILASRLLDIIIHDEFWIGFVTFVVNLKRVLRYLLVRLNGD